MKKSCENCIMNLKYKCFSSVKKVCRDSGTFIYWIGLKEDKTKKESLK